MGLIVLTVWIISALINAGILSLNWYLHFKNLNRFPTIEVVIYSVVGGPISILATLVILALTAKD